MPHKKNKKANKRLATCQPSAGAVASVNTSPDVSEEVAQPSTVQLEVEIVPPEVRELEKALVKLTVANEASVECTDKGAYKPDVGGCVGSRGRPIMLKVNHFQLYEPSQPTTMFYYTLTIRVYKKQVDKQTMTVGFKSESEAVKLPKAASKALFMEMLKQHASTFGKNRFEYLYDGGTILFAKHQVITTKDVFSVTASLPDQYSEGRYEMELVYQRKFVMSLVDGKVNVFNNERSDALVAVDLMLRQARMFSLQPVYYLSGPRSYSVPPEYLRCDRWCHWLEAGKFRYDGMFQSARPSDGWKSTMILDVASAVFYQHGPVSEYLEAISPDFKRTGVVSGADRAILERELKGLKVNLKHHVSADQTHNIRRYRVNGVKEGANKLMIPDLNITVEAYFRERATSGQFARSVQHSDWPCLWVGNKQRNIWIPMEFCEIVEGQRCQMKLSDYQTAIMLKQNVTDAPTRLQNVVSLAKESFSNDPYCKEYGFSFGRFDPMKVQGRVQPMPTIGYKDNKKCEPRKDDGSWRMSGRSQAESYQFFIPCTVHDWTLVTCDPSIPHDDQRLLMMCELLRKEANTRGIQMPAVIKPFAAVSNVDKMKPLFANLKEKIPKLNLIIVVTPYFNSPFYAYAKAFAELTHKNIGVTTQCIVRSTILKFNPAVAGNLTLKINSKLGGVNLMFPVVPSIGNDPCPKEVSKMLETPILIVGADVCHPSPGQDDTPSVAAIVGSVGSFFAGPAKFWPIIKVQMSRKEKRKSQEVILEMNAAMRELIIRFYDHNRKLPYRILMFRDGVSDGQFVTVLKEELHAIRTACEAAVVYLAEQCSKSVSEFMQEQKNAWKKLGLISDGLKDASYQPPITFYVTQKRHHTRFFCADTKDETGKGRNVPPGTTVDHDVTWPPDIARDFYLCSHGALQGVARPIHYHVLCDENKFKPDFLQALPYYLCFAFVRCTRSVSIPAPVYYADLLAYRGRIYLDTYAKGISLTDDVLKDMQKHVNVMDSVKEQGMFYV